MIRLLPIWLLCVLSALTTNARTILVGPGNACTRVADALSAAHAGDTISVAKGIYHEKNLVINKAIVLLGQDFPTLDGDHKYELISVKASGVIIRGFTITHSGVSSLEEIAGIKIYGVRDVLVENNRFNDVFFGVYVQGASHCTIRDNVFRGMQKNEQESGNGIHCWKSDSLLIIHNDVSGHRDGIYFEFVTNSVIWRNISSENLRYGLHFMFSHNDSYFANIFRNNGAGVSVMFSHGVHMMHNYFLDNWGDGAFGLLLKEISDSYITGNEFSGNTTGIYMEGASRVKMERNTFSGNGWALKIQASCMDNSIASCDFRGNTFDIGTNGSLVLNNFDGNYWDRYEGYDLNRDKTGDVPYHPVSLFSVIVEKNNASMMLFRGFMTTLLDKTEKIIPSLTPENLKDNYPKMKPCTL
jgi:nitrous oxidase accessory protein